MICLFEKNAPRCSLYDYRYEISVGDFSFEGSQELPTELIALFTEDDRVSLVEQVSVNGTNQEEASDGASKHIKTTSLEEGDVIENPEAVGQDDGAEACYSLPVSVLRQRMEIMGFTNVQWQQELKEFVDQQIAYGIWRVEQAEASSPEWLRAKRRLKILEQSSLERWMKKLMLVNDRVWTGLSRSPEDTLEYALFDRKTDGPESIFSRQIIFLRGALEVGDDDDEVTLDFSNAIEDEVVALDDPLSNIGRDRLLQPVREFEKILILTEGRTDARILRDSFASMRPEIAHLYSYMDHETFKAEGGTSALVHLARSLAAAGIPNRIVFLFDNDTAGYEGLRKFEKERLPKHYKAITLPHLNFAESYPTIGPTGEALADINERACGIELYCGPKALTKHDGQPCAIQWTGYNAGMKRYQGEPLDKDGIKERYTKMLAVSPHAATDPEFESMRLVLAAISGLRWV
jgi:hypothetical protein